MNPVEIIERKRDGKRLTKVEIEAFVRGCTDGSFKDYQLSAMLMAITLRGMTPRETVNLTMAMAHSGDMLDLSEIEGVKADKHSTGGVGDTTTLVLTPLVAACGLKVAKMSGRGLGHTGGTLDKLESVPGLCVSMDRARFIRQVNEIGCAVIGQTATLAPADKALYALRDVTATVESMPLVVSSILSKKLASGADVVVLDVKTGSGAVMKTLEKSLELAETMVDIGNRTGRRFSALVTDMSQPLGLQVGNALEVEEAIDILSGRVTGDLLEVSLRLGARMLVSAGLAPCVAAAREKLQKALDQGYGLEKLGELFERQGGDRRVTDDTRLLPQAKTFKTITAKRAGYLSVIHTGDIGNAARALGAGRIKKEDVIDPAVGIVMKARLGDCLNAGDPICELRLGPKSRARAAEALLDGAFEFSETPVAKAPLIYEEMAGGEA